MKNIANNYLALLFGWGLILLRQIINVGCVVRTKNIFHPSFSKMVRKTHPTKILLYSIHSNVTK